jgi:hypothetical protein
MNSRIVFGRLMGILILIGIALPASLAASRQARADPAIGTWELNLAKSKYFPGRPPKSQTRTFEISGRGVKYVAEEIDARGNWQLIRCTANYDGKEYPIIGSGLAETISLKRVDAFTVTFTQKKAGKVVVSGRRVVSRDRKTMTVLAQGTNATGRPFSDVLVFDRKTARP